MVKVKRSNRNQTGLAGEYAVLSQLSARGFDAALTLGNAKSLDILVRNPETGEYFAVEVKTSSTKAIKNSKDFGNSFKWQIGVGAKEISDKRLFYCFVNLADDYNKHRFFVVPAGIVAKHLKEAHAYWIKGKPRRGKTRKESGRTIFRIALDKNKIGKFKKTPSAEDHENKWGLLLK